MVELNIRPRLGYVTFTYSTGLNYRIQGKFSRESNLPTTLLALLVCFFIFFSMVFSNLATNLPKKKISPYFLGSPFSGKYRLPTVVKSCLLCGKHI